MTAPEPQLFDAGLQPERTQLSWRRTALSIGVGSLVALRLFPELVGSAWGLVPGLLGVLFAGWLWFEGHRRYLAFQRSHAGGAARPAGAAALLVLAAFACVFGCLALVVVYVRLA